MTAQELFNYLTLDAGLDTETAVALTKAAANPKVAERATSLAQRKDFDSIQQKATDLETKYNQAATYEQWYTTNYDKIVALQTERAAYEAKFGKLDGTGGNPNPNPSPAGGKQYSEEDIQRMVDTRIQTAYGPKWSDLLVDSGEIVLKHVSSGRKTKLDLKSLAKTAAEKHNGNLNAAYDEWDKPEAERISKEATDAEVERRVQEKVAQMRTQSTFLADQPSNGGSAGLTRRPAPVDKTAPAPVYDRSKVIEAAMNPDAAKAADAKVAASVWKN